MSTKSKDSEEIEESSEDPSERVVDDLPEVEESSSSTTEEDDKDQPTIDDDEMADLAAIAEDVQKGTENDESEDSEDPDEDESGSSEESSRSSTSSSSRSWGKMYTKGVVKTSEAIVEEFGEAGADPITEQDVRDLELDEAFDEWMAEKTGRPEDIPPGQWVAIGTILLIGGNAITETNLASEALNDAI